MKLEGVAVSCCSQSPFSPQGHPLMSILGGAWYKPCKGLVLGERGWRPLRHSERWGPEQETYPHTF